MAVTNKKSVSEAIKYRRSVLVFKKEPIDEQKVKDCIHLATLAVASSNIQLWEFHHIISPVSIKEIAAASFDQNGAKTAQQLVIVVARKDLWRKRMHANISFLKSQFGNKSEAEYSTKDEFALNYYKKIIPTIYTDFLVILGGMTFIVFYIIGLFKFIYRHARQSDMSTVADKNAGLAAQNFMISMAALNFNTCLMEGFHSIRIKKILNIPSVTEINMIIGCGLSDEQGIYGERFRIPFEKIYHKI